MNKEQIYDEHISPLMNRIIRVCQEHGIGMVATYHIPTPDDEGLRCTSVVLDVDKDVGSDIDQALVGLLVRAGLRA